MQSVQMANHQRSDDYDSAERVAYQNVSDSNGNFGGSSAAAAGGEQSVYEVYRELPPAQDFPALASQKI